MKAYYFNRLTGKIRVPPQVEVTISEKVKLPRYYLNVTNEWLIGIEGEKEEYTQGSHGGSTLIGLLRYGRVLTPMTTPRHPEVAGTAVGPHGHLYRFFRDGGISAGCRYFKSLDEVKDHYLRPSYNGVYRNDPQDGVDFIELHLSALKHLMED